MQTQYMAASSKSQSLLPLYFGRIVKTLPQGNLPVIVFCDNWRKKPVRNLDLKGNVMSALALLKSTIIDRKSPRYIFRRRAVMTAGTTTIHVRTLDVSEHGFGVVAAEPVNTGETCSLVLNGLIGEHIVQQTFSCEIIYCILSGVDGFRIGLSIHNTVDSPKQRLQQIIASCSPSFA